ncbi:carbohydrate kinase [Caldimicrobium thiodismutans]|uniref:Carbohydrate kinase n=1 Tax=Caldimicrobium thiodismutans TaxID=1653476 RepID=A0A0U5AY76_9BACT|nr:D-glycero-beta-D-manno-heptose-7-phosphate kinase [Caldimicrobium thiodismutans]BAU22681.1 carbohydrate kinase [Caldimicrobium thiodismutans]
MLSKINLSQLEESLSKVKILVVGDLILDRYFWGSVERISPEAPVPVFDLKEITHSLGGSANVSANLRGLSVQTFLMGVVGKDEKGDLLIKIAEECGINTQGILKDPERPTTLKTRVIAQSQQLLRIDKEVRLPLSSDIKKAFQEIYEELLSNVDGVILSDYAKGMFLSDSFCNWLIEEAKRHKKFIMIDPKSADWKKYQGATSITPNLKEFKEVLRYENLKEENLDEASFYLVKKYELDFLVVTLGKEGIYLFQPEKGGLRLASQAREVFDVSGAGDTVIASLSAFFGAGFSIEDAVTLANICAGIVVGKVGTQPVYLEELKKFLKEGGSHGKNCQN